MFLDKRGIGRFLWRLGLAAERQTLMSGTLLKDATLRDVRSMLPKAESFVRRVLGVMLQHKRAHGSAMMRLGITGTGQAPNYRIETQAGEPIVAIDGANHGPWPEEARFEGSENWSTATMSEQDIKELIGEIRPFAPKARDGGFE